MSDGIAAKDIRKLIAERFKDPRQYAVAYEVGNSTGGSQYRRLDTDLDPSECGACWRSLMEWLGDPYRKVHELIALDKQEEE